MGFSAAPPVDQHPVARLPGRMRRGFHHRRRIDARDHREPPHHRRLAGDGEPILVIHRQPFRAQRHVALHQVPLVEIGERGGGAGVLLGDDDGLECGHGGLSFSVAAPTCRCLSAIAERPQGARARRCERDAPSGTGMPVDRKRRNKLQSSALFGQHDERLCANTFFGGLRRTLPMTLILAPQSRFSSAMRLRRYARSSICYDDCDGS